MIVSVLVVGTVAGCAAALWRWVTHDYGTDPKIPVLTQVEKDNWRMPALDTMPPAKLSARTRVWMAVLRGYLVIAGGIVLVHIVHLTMAGETVSP